MSFRIILTKRLSQSHELIEDVEALIDSAQRTLMIHSFELSSSKIIRAIERAIGRGVNLDLIVGNHELIGAGPFLIGDQTKKCLAKFGSHRLYHPESLKSCGF